MTDQEAVNSDGSSGKVSDSVCPRCHTECATKYSVIRHLQAKTLCAATYSQESAQDIIDRLRVRHYTEDSVRCPICSRQFKNQKTLAQHARICEQAARQQQAAAAVPDTTAVVAGLQATVMKLQKEMRVLQQTAAAGTSAGTNSDAGTHELMNDEHDDPTSDEQNTTPDTASGVAIIPGIPVTIRKTNGTPPLVSVIDLIAAVKAVDTHDAAKEFRKLKKSHPEGTNFPLCKFPGERQRDTPVTDARGVVTIINLLSGPKPAAFRAQFADIVVRFLGGDETLVAQIRRNAEIQATLPANHPAAFFGQSVGAEQGAIIEVTSLEPDAGQPELSLPDATRPPNCVYCIFIGYCAATDRRVYTFGLTQDLRARIVEHRRTFPHAKVVFVVSLGQFDPASIEAAVRDMEPVRSRALKVSLPNGVNRQDCFACAKHEVEGVLRELLSELKRSHGHKVQDMWAYDPALLPGLPGLPGPGSDADMPMIEYGGGATTAPPLQSKSPPTFAGWGPVLPDPAVLVQMEREKTRQVELTVEAERIKAETEREREKTRQVELTVEAERTKADREREKTAQLRLQLQLEMLRQGQSADHVLNTNQWSA